MASKSLREVRKTQKIGQDRLVTLIDKQGRDIHDQDKIIARMEKFCTELNDSEQSTIIHLTKKGTSDNIMGGGSRYEEWDSNRQRPYKHRDIESRGRYHLEDTFQAVH